MLSQYYNSPIYLNPALTGKLNSNWRVVANYRNQYTAVSNPSPFTSFGVSVDAGVLRERLNDDIIGFGLLFFNDNQAGSVLRTQHIMFSTAYHKGFGYKKDHFLSAGFQFDLVHRGLNINALDFEDEFTGTDFNGLTLENIQTTSIWYPNMNAGLFWSSYFSKMFSAFGGVSLHNILTPKESFTGAPSERNMRYSASAGVVIDINKFVLISPNGLYFKQGPADQIIAGSSFGFNLSGTRRPYETTLYVGGWYNLNGAIIGSAGFQFKGMQVGFSYDNNIGDIQGAAKNYGAIEISLIFVDKPIERNKSYQLLHCPKF